MDKPAESMLYSLKVVFSGESLEIGRGDKNIVLGPKPGIEGGIVEVVHLADIGLDISP